MGVKEAWPTTNQTIFFQYFITNMSSRLSILRFYSSLIIQYSEIVKLNRKSLKAPVTA